MRVIFQQKFVGVLFHTEEKKNVENTRDPANVSSPILTSKRTSQMRWYIYIRTPPTWPTHRDKKVPPPPSYSFVRIEFDWSHGSYRGGDGDWSACCLCKEPTTSRRPFHCPIARKTARPAELKKRVVISSAWKFFFSQKWMEKILLQRWNKKKKNPWGRTRNNPNIKSLLWLHTQSDRQ